MIDNDPSVRSSRRRGVYHEFAHGLGLSDTVVGRYGATVMYAYTNTGASGSPRSTGPPCACSTTPRLDPGDRRPEAMRMWRNIP